MKPLLFAMPGNENFTGRLIAALGAELGSLETRYFPDGETYVRLAGDVEGQSVVLVCTLDRPNDKTRLGVWLREQAVETLADDLGWWEFASGPELEESLRDAVSGLERMWNEK